MKQSVDLCSNPCSAFEVSLEKSSEALISDLSAPSAVQAVLRANGCSSKGWLSSDMSTPRVKHDFCSFQALA